MRSISVNVFSELLRWWDNQGHQPAVWSQDRAAEEPSSQRWSQHQDVHSPRFPSTDRLRQAAGGGENWGKKSGGLRLINMYVCRRKLVYLQGVLMFLGTSHSNGWPTWTPWSTWWSRPTWSSWTPWTAWCSHGPVQPWPIQPGTSRTSVSIVFYLFLLISKAFVDY